MILILVLENSYTCFLFVEISTRDSRLYFATLHTAHVFPPAFSGVNSL